MLLDTLTMTLLAVVVLPAASHDWTRKWYSVVSVRPLSAARWDMPMFVSTGVAAPYAGVVPYATDESLGLSVVQLIVAPDAEAVARIAETTGGMFETVTATLAAFAALPAASRATAVSVWLPSDVAVVSQLTAYGALATSAPRLTPSSLNCTPATPMLSAAAAAIETLPRSAALAAGAVSDTDGAVPSSVVNVASLDVARLPAASCDSTRK